MPVLSNILNNDSARMQPNQPNGGQPNPMGAVANAIPPAGNSQSRIMQILSGMLGGGDPMQEQNNAYVKGQVDRQQAIQQQAQQLAQKKGQQATARALKATQQTISANPNLPTTTPGTTPASPLQNLWQSLTASLSGK